ncbi:MAG: hypothetical protein ABI999_13825 [Acidobacteriota bacterium]
MSSEIVSTNPAVRAVLEGKAPRPAQLAAARGILPLPPIDQLEILVSFVSGGDAELADHAKKSLLSQDTSTLEAVLRSKDVAPAVLAHFATRDEFPLSVHEAIVTNAKTPQAALVEFAKTSTKGELLELLSHNQQLMIQIPGLIEAILGNSNRTPESERRALETKREFFEKERGAAQIASELRAQGKEAAAEFIEKAEFATGDITDEDAAFFAEHIVVPDRETDDSWLALEYLEELYEESDADRKAAVSKILGEMREDGEIPSERVSMLYRVMKLNVKDRIRLGTKGDREARNILIRDPNRLVSQAVVQNPRITEQEVEQIASMRTAGEDILRQIAASRHWSRSYSIVHNLVRNPRTPIGNSMTIMSRMQLKDLIALSNNRNVSDAVRRHALRLANARKGK